jgi:threonylcarbamoyladenosine tRNA methylthiotransferase MtaB
VKTKRVQMLEDLCRELHEEFVKSNAGVHEKVLFESTDRKGMMEGYTGNYIRVSREYDPELIGKIVDVVL